MAVTVHHGHEEAGATASRPTTAEAGFQFYDTTLAKTIVFNGTTWEVGAAVAANAATLTVTAALHAGRVIAFGKLDGCIVTLPAATGTGNIYTFVISITATSNANIIKVANATDVMNGSTISQQDTDADGTLKMWLAEVGDDTITLAGAATTGGIVGNTITVIDYAAGFFACEGSIVSGGGAEVTPFSATVS